MTGKWELALHEITDGKQDETRFMDGIRRMSAFLVDYARNKGPAVAFPPEAKRKSGTGRGGLKTKPLEGSVCPLCGKGKLLESPQAFSCDQNGCSCVIWKNGLDRGGGPAITDRLLLLLLEKRQLKGSTGTLMIREGKILFYPNGSDAPSAVRSLAYERKKT